MAVGGRLRLLLGIADPLRPDSPAGVARLRSLGLQPVLATVDTLETAAATALAAGITIVDAELMPADKSALAMATSSVTVVGNALRLRNFGK